LLEVRVVLLAIGPVHIDYTEVVVILHQDGFDVLKPALSGTAIKIVDDKAEGLFLIVDDAVLVLIVL
jgi:hypothetical protein